MDRYYITISEDEEPVAVSRVTEDGDRATLITARTFEEAAKIYAAAAGKGAAVGLPGRPSRPS